MAFFMGDYLRPPAVDLPWIVAGEAATFVVTQIVKNVILNADPAHDFRHALVSLDQRLEAVLRGLLRQPIERPGRRPNSAGSATG